MPPIFSTPMAAIAFSGAMIDAATKPEYVRTDIGLNLVLLWALNSCLYSLAARIFMEFPALKPRLRPLEISADIKLRLFFALKFISAVSLDREELCKFCL